MMMVMMTMMMMMINVMLVTSMISDEGIFNHTCGLCGLGVASSSSQPVSIRADPGSEGGSLTCCWGFSCRGRQLI